MTVAAASSAIAVARSLWTPAASACFAMAVGIGALAVIDGANASAAAGPRPPAVEALAGHDQLLGTWSPTARGRKWVTPPVTKRPTPV